MAETLEKKHERIMLRFDRAYSPQKEVREKCIEATRFARVPGGQWEGATAAGTKLDEQFEKYPKFEINKVATELNRIIAEYRNNRITVKFRPGDREASEELANKLNGLFRADYEETDGGEACDNAFDDAATDLETELAHFMMNNGALSLGSPNTPITKWSDVAQTASFLKDLGVNEGENYAVMDPWSAQRLADAQTGLHASDQLVRTAWENAQIPTNFGGIRALMSNGLASRTQGAFGGTLTVKTQPTVTYNAVKDSYQFTVTLTGATASVTGFLKAGDQVKFTNTYWLQQQTKQALYNGATPISFTATVTADANSDSGGDVTVTLSGVPIYDTTNPQYNSVSRQVEAGDAVSVVGTASQTMKPNLFYNKFFCGLGSIPLPKLHSIDSAVATYEGFSIRVHKYADGDANVQKMRFDLLPAYVCFNPHMGGQFFGNS
ncbi:P22 phage major capsid protein family protein [Escherichia coli]